MLGFINIVLGICMTVLIAIYRAKLWKNLIWIPAYVLFVVALYYFESAFLSLVSILSFVATLIIYNTIIKKEKRNNDNGNT